MRARALLAIVMLLFGSCSFQRLTAVDGLSLQSLPPIIDSVTGNGAAPDRIDTGLVISGSHLGAVSGARLLTEAGALVGELVVSSANATLLEASIPSQVATAVIGLNGAALVLEITNAAGVARQTITILRGEDGQNTCRSTRGGPGPTSVLRTRLGFMAAARARERSTALPRAFRSAPLVISRCRGWPSPIRPASPSTPARPNCPQATPYGGCFACLTPAVAANYDVYITCLSAKGTY